MIRIDRINGVNYMRDYPELNGQLVGYVGQAGVYLVDKGKKRGIGSQELYNKLFIEGIPVQRDTNVGDINFGPEIPPFASTI